MVGVAGKRNETQMMEAVLPQPPLWPHHMGLKSGRGEVVAMKIGRQRLWRAGEIAVAA